MSGPLLYDFGGLVTAPGLLARNPASCVDVQNFRFPQPGVMRKRTGYARQTGAVVNNEFFQAIYSSAQLNDKFLALGSAFSGAPPVYYGSPAAGWTALTDTVTSGSPARGMGVVGNSHFVNCSTIKRVENSYTRLRNAGMPRGQLPWTYSMNAAVYSVLTGAGGIVPDGSNVAYRVTYCRKDDQGGIIEGPPTSRLVIRNINGTSGWGVGVARNVTLRIPVPNEVGSNTLKCGTDTFWRLYRSRISAVDTADDEMYLVAEAFFTAGDIANGYAVTTDQTPDVFLYGAPTLHTNALNFPEAGPSGPTGAINGQVLANEAPWAAFDIAEFGGCLFAAAPQAHPSLLLTLLSSTFAAGNTVVVAGITLKAVAGAPAAAGEFTIVGGLGSISLNIEATARNMVDAFNRAALGGSGVAQMHYISQGASLPGQILIEGNDNGFFTAQSVAAGTLFRPDITAAQGSTGAASRSNSLTFSKPRRGDAFAPANELTVGPGSATIWRIVAFRERLLCWTSEGLYQVDGTYESGFTVSLVDSSLHLFERFAVVVAEDRCFAWCFEGIAEVSDGGTRIISQPIEPTLAVIARSRPPAALLTGPIFDDAFAVYDRLNHLLQLFYSAPGRASAEPWCSDWLEYDTREQKWSTGNCAVTKFGDGAVQRSTNLVVLTFAANSGGNPLGKTACTFVQRNSGAASDYQDADISAASTAISSTATFQFQLPDSDARQHWQQLLLHFENGDFSYLTKPTTVLVRWETDVATSSELTLTPSSAIAKLETPQVTRRATRQRVRLRHLLAENMGLVVLNQSVNGNGSRFPK